MKCSNKSLVCFIIFLLLSLFAKSKDAHIHENKINILQTDSFLTNPKMEIYNVKQKFHKCNEDCLECNNEMCIKCKRGFYAYLHSCFRSCPFELVADNLELTCKMTVQNPIYTKAYSVSSCLNACGNSFTDCSCKPDCIKNGTCCSDYKICDLISMEGNNVYNTQESNCSKLKNCQFCTKDGMVCLQCKSKYYYLNNECLEECPNNMNRIKENGLCINKCSTKNCENCENFDKCSKCEKGFFLFDNECVEKCPFGLFANRIDFTCIRENMKPYYWIYPSINSCNNTCEKETEECSCKGDCMRKGNCCDDFIYYCNKEQNNENCRLCENCAKEKCLFCKKNSAFNNMGICECIKNFSYDIIKDSCYLNKEITSLLKKSPRSISHRKNKNLDEEILLKEKKLYNKIMNNIHNSIDNKSHKSGPVKKDFSNLLQEKLASSFEDLLSRSNSSKMTILSGNFSLNSLEHNINTELIRNDTITVNSNNINNSTEDNVNSHNNLNKISSSGDVRKHINRGSINLNNKIYRDVSRKPKENSARKRQIDENMVLEKNHDFHHHHVPVELVSQPVTDRIHHSDEVIVSHPVYESIPMENYEKVSYPVTDAQPIENYEEVSNHVSEPRSNELITHLDSQNIEHDIIQSDFPIFTKNCSVKSNSTLISNKKLLDKKEHNQNKLNIHILAHPSPSSRGSLLGDNNNISDNHVVNNYIQFHNNYIVGNGMDGKINNFVINSSLINNSSFNKTGFNHFPNTLLIFNANKEIKGDSYCLKALCEICKDNMCLKCKQNSLQLLDKTCKCKDGFYFNEEFDQCEKCHHLCSTCWGSSNSRCHSCSINAIMVHNSTCVLNRGNDKVIHVSKCNIDLCERCTSSGKCLQCKINSFYDEIKNKCICSEDFFPRNNSCHYSEKCMNSIFACERCIDGQCVKCFQNAFLNKINSTCTCKKGFQANYKTNICEKHSKCDYQILCENCSNDFCYKCVDNAHLLEKSKCKCNPGFEYKESKNKCKKLISKENICLKNKLCKLCDINGNCHICKKYSFKNIEGDCMCIEGFVYYSQENKCIRNSLLCNVTEGPSKSCLKCDGKRCIECKNKAILINGKCICSNGYEYKFTEDRCVLKNKDNLISLTCKKFTELCELCQNNRCLKCKENSYLNTTINRCKCTDTFKYNFLKDRCEEIIREDQKCNGNISKLCRKCKKGQCTECGQNSYLNTLNNTCYCYPGFTQYDDLCSINLNNYNKCSIENCQVCKENKCLECSDYSFMTDNNECKCIFGYEFNKTIKRCQRIDSCKTNYLCKNCLNGRCSSCKENSKLVDNSCICRKGFYHKEGNCELKPEFTCEGKDNPLCLKCEDKTSCLKCKSNADFNMKYSANTCFCNKGYLYNLESKNCEIHSHEICRNKIELCVKCNKNNKCNQCKNRAYMHNNICTCLPGHYYDVQIDECISPCQIGNFFNILLNNCESCPKRCKKCENKSKCDKCMENAYRNGNKCKCKTGFLYNPSQNTCVQNSSLQIIIKKQKKCVEFSLCSNCNKAKGCMKCKENAIYIQETKNCTCQNGYFHSKPKEICKKCHSLCKSCFGPSNQECFRCFRNNYTQYIEETNTCECKGDFMFDDESQQCIKKTPYKIIEKGNISYSFNKSFDYCEKGYKLSNAKHCEENKITQNKELYFSFVYYLHGVRSPSVLDDDLKDILDQEWKSPSYLTKEGMRQDYLFGQYLQDYYMYQTNLLDKNINKNQIRFDSANSNLEISSAYSLMRGLLHKINSTFNITKNISACPFERKQRYRREREIDNLKVLNQHIVEYTEQPEEPFSIISMEKHKYTYYNSSNNLIVQESKNKSLENDLNILQGPSCNNNTKSLEIANNSNINEVILPVHKFENYFNLDLDNIGNCYSSYSNMKDNNAINMLPVHTFTNYSSHLGIENLGNCVGAASYIDDNYLTNKKSLDLTISKLGCLFNIVKRETIHNKTIDKIWIIAEALFAGLKTANPNITNLNVSSKVINLLETEFMNHFIYKMFYGDKNNYLSSIVISPSFSSFINNFNTLIENEKGVVREIISRLRQDKSLNNKIKKEIHNRLKLQVYVPKEEVFWGVLIYLSRQFNRTLNVPMSSTSIRIDLVKDTTGFDMMQFIDDEVNFFPNKFNSNSHEIERVAIFNEFLGNPKKFSINLYIDDQMITHVAFSDFKAMIEKDLVDHIELKNFCFPKSLVYFYLICLILISFIIFELLVLACIYSLRYA